MPRTSIATQTLTYQSGATITFSAADSANNMLFSNDGETLLVVKNGGASSITVTVVSVADLYGRTGDISASVAAGATWISGPLEPSIWNQTSSDLGKTYVNFSSATSVTVGAIKYA